MMGSFAFHATCWMPFSHTFQRADNIDGEDGISLGFAAFVELSAIYHLMPRRDIASAYEKFSPAGYSYLAIML